MPVVPELNLSAVIGFEGSIPNGLIQTTRNGRDYIVYALGSTVVVRDIEAETKVETGE